ncbi:class I SAM-dependent DNA methyltransferase [Nocardioides rubriscoriae]|uniref:class I SAM-dependent DNA methyltransferase n=1 Tax=Nocardioides rubriscoriae TaxID=642762 RepID=UPI0011DF884B|nr:DNA methyltransferase [Nocardioides rubriscoriae]
MSDALVQKADSEDFDHLFRLDLFWGGPDHAPIQIELDDGSKVTATNVSSYKGVRVWEVPALPGSAGEAKLDQLIAKNSTNRLVIFHDDGKQVWRWPSRSSKGGGVISRPARHVHKVGNPDPKFAAKLDAIRLPQTGVDVNELLSRVRGAFDVETKNETRRASKLMAQMYAAVEKGYPASFDVKQRDHEISVTLARVLFLLFGDDTEMWKSEDGEPLPDLFQDFIKDHTDRDGADIAARLNSLFVALDTAPNKRAGLAPELAMFPYVNGGIFDEKITLPELDNDFRKAILDASAVDWSTISPAIFGSMFQSVRDAQTRRELGEHYTSEENILKTLNPLFLDELRAEFDAARERDTAQKRINALNALWKKIGDIRYMDPACGCGNFIIVAYRELRDLELRIMDALADNQQGEDAAALDADWTHLLKVTLDHFYGIEIDEWPARIAETAMFLIDRQCDLKMKERFGVAPERLPIQKSAKISVGNALQLSWAEILEPSENVVVAGNPPFLGISLRSAAQTAELQAVWGARYHGTLDYVTGWHACALSYFGAIAARWAFVTTNSIMQGEAAAPLFRPILDAGWQIKFAHRTFKWTSEASGQAAVHCVIIGFARDPGVKRLFDYPTIDSSPVEVTGVKTINPYLVDAANVLVESVSRPLNPQMGEVTYGNKPTDGGWLIVEDDALAEARADSVAAKYLRPYVGARELLHGVQRHCLWLVDSTPSERKHSPFISERVKGRRTFLLDSDAASTRAYADQAHLFRQISQPEVPYLCIPRHVSETRPYFLSARFPASVICSDANFLSEDADGMVFAIISSKMFMVWQRTVGGRIKSDIRFNKLLSWNTFPLPTLTEADRTAIIDGGHGVLEARATLSDVSLAGMYPASGMDPGLQRAHDSLDKAVDMTFGLKHADRITDLERQEILFAKYLELSSGLLAGLSATRSSRRRTTRRPS